MRLCFDYILHKQAKCYLFESSLLGSDVKNNNLNAKTECNSIRSCKQFSWQSVAKYNLKKIFLTLVGYMQLDSGIGLNITKPLIIQCARCLLRKDLPGKARQNKGGAKRVEGVRPNNPEI